MSEEKRKFLEIKNLKKSFGTEYKPLTPMPRKKADLRPDKALLTALYLHKLVGSGMVPQPRTIRGLRKPTRPREALCESRNSY